MTNEQRDDELAFRERAQRAFDDYVRKLDRGETASPEDLLAAHEGLADYLRPLLRSLAAEDDSEPEDDDPFQPGKLIKEETKNGK